MIFTNHQYSVVGFLLPKNRTNERRAEMERLTAMHGGMMVPRKACTFDREGGADDCKECTEICEDAGGVCRTCSLQECLKRLGEYEDTGLTPEQIRELLERDTAKAVDNRTIIQNFSGAPPTIMGDCPSCGCENIKSCNADFCPACGQRLKWEE